MRYKRKALPRINLLITGYAGHGKSTFGEYDPSQDFNVTATDDAWAVSCRKRPPHRLLPGCKALTF
jgi:hypothetical protein